MVTAAPVRPSTARIVEVSAMLPAQPAAIGAPVTDRVAWAAIATRVPLREILAEADRRVNLAPPAITDDLYLTYSRTGVRTTYESVYYQRTDRLTTFAWAEALDGRGRYLSALQREIDAMLDEKSWLWPAHDPSLTNFYGRSVDVDLAAAMRGWTLATAAGWFGTDLGAARLARVQSELRRRVIDPYLNAVRVGNQGAFWWIESNSNWNAVCHAGVSGTALLAVADRNVRAEVLAAAEANLPRFVSGFTGDGYCSEGIGYWSYGYGCYVLLAETVATVTSGRLRLLQGAKLERINAFPAGMEITSGIYPAFSDNRSDVQPSVWVAPLARRGLDGGDVPARLPAPGWLEVARDQLYISAVRLWAPSTVAPSTAAPEPELRHWFDEAQMLTTRAAVDFGGAIKGGHNDELHNHNDLGSFVIALGKTALLVDPGSEVYTARTFSAQRYDSNVLNSYGHGVPLVAGKLQSTGRAYAARVLATDWSRDRDRLLLDLKGGYQVPTLRRLEREFVCRRGVGEGFTITDEFEYTTPENFGTALITFSPWRALDATSLEIGSGADRVNVRLENEGGPIALRSEVIQENLTGGLKATRIGIDFAQPVVRGKIRVHVTRATPVISPARADAAPSAAAAQLVNLSTLGATRAGEGALIAGFSVAGTGRKSVLLRAVGPGLTPFGVSGTLRDPRVVVRGSAGEIARNDDWSATALGGVAARVGAFALPAGSADAGLLVGLPSGSYTAQIESADGSAGTALIELYDAGGTDSRLVNLSTRGTVTAGSPLTIGLVVGSGGPRWLLFRGIGASLATFGIGEGLADPVLTVFQGGKQIAQNDDWSLSYWTTEVERASSAAGAFALGGNAPDAALLVQLPPGGYTFQISGKGNARGTVLGEAYELP
jgi:hypothetical protein